MNQAALPGSEILQRGLDDLAANRPSVEALLVEIAAPRLRFVGVEVPVIPPPRQGEHSDAELRLYVLLGRQGCADPYREYNALLRRLASLCSALERELGRSIRGQREASGRRHAGGPRRP